MEFYYIKIIMDVLHVGTLFFAIMTLFFTGVFLHCDNKGKALNIVIYCLIILLSFFVLLYV